MACIALIGVIESLKFFTPICFVKFIIMTKYIKGLFLFTAIAAFAIIGCSKEGPRGYPGPSGVDGQNGLNGVAVISSGWITPTSWTGSSGKWYFNVHSSDLDTAIVEYGMILAYASLVGDSTPSTVRPLPAYLKANFNFLIPTYDTIKFTCDVADTTPPSLKNKFRFIAIPATALAHISLKSASVKDLKSMSYKEVCKLYNIPE